LARIICIDYGGKRCGLAVTDPLQIIATALTTVDTKELFTFLVDERYSSKNAVRAMVEMGMKKNDRRDKKTIDRVAATMLLQEYLSNRS